MLIAFCMVFLFLGAAIFAVAGRWKDEGFYSTGFVFTLGAFFYFISIPIEKFARGIENGFATNVFLGVPVWPDFHVKVFAMGLAAIIFFILGLRLSGFKSKAPDVALPDKGQGVAVFEGALWVMWLSLICIMLVFFDDFIHRAMRSYEDSYSVQYSSPLPTLICQLIEILNAVLGVCLGLRKRIVPMMGATLLFALNFALTFLFTEKSPAVISMIGMGCLYFALIRDRRLAIVGALSGIILLIFVLKPVFDIISTYKYPANQIVDQLLSRKPTLLNLDSAGPMAVIAHTLEEEEKPFWGQELVQTFSIFVPRTFWQDRPADPSEAVAQEIIPNWKPGMGMGYSPLIEGYRNFGFWLSPLEFFIFGLLWGWLWRGFMKAFAFYNAPAHLDIIYRVAGYYVLILFFRGMIAGSLKQALMYIIPFAISLAGMQMLVWLSNRPQIKRFID